MRHITIVGGGQAGLVLAIGLLQAGQAVRVVQNRSAGDIARGKVMSTQCVFGAARAYERQLGLDLWNDTAPAVSGMRVAVAAPDGSGNKAFGFVGNLKEPAQSVDQRIKFPRFMEAFVAQGGTLDIADAGIDDLERYAKDSDLVIVAAGKGPVTQLFARDDARSPHDKPMRALSVVYTRGTTPYDKTCVTATLVPGLGEVFMIPSLTASGLCEILFIEAIPGGPLDAFDPAMDVGTQLEKTKALIKQHLSWEYDRIAGAVPTDANGGLVGRVTATVRKGIGILPSGRAVLGLADAVILNDPIVGQGSNNAIKAAAIYCDAIVKRGDAPYDAAWMEATYEAGFRRVEASTLWSNMMLTPPPPHVVELLARASGKPELADKVAEGFNEPGTLVPLFADPALAAAA